MNAHELGEEEARVEAQLQEYAQAIAQHAAAIKQLREDGLRLIGRLDYVKELRQRETESEAG